MMAAAAVMTRPAAAIPSATAALASPVRHHASWIRETRNTSWSMDSPKVMVNIISGIHGSMGPVRRDQNETETEFPDRMRHG
jgi:hypothetical protein